MMWGYFAACAVIALSLWRIDHLGGELEREKVEHRQTKAELAAALEKGAGWEAACNEALASANAHSEATLACLKREVDAWLAAGERSAILQDARPRPRDEVEKQQVVDDETRKLAADRLNRPL